MDMTSFKQIYDMISKKHGRVGLRVLNGAGKERLIEGTLEDTIGEDIVVWGDDYLSLSDILGLRALSGAARPKEPDSSPQPAPEGSSKIELKVESATAASTAPTEHSPMPSKKNMVGAASAQNTEQRQNIQKGTLNNAQNPPPSVQAVSPPNLPHLPDFHFDASGCFQELKEMFNLCHKTALSKYNAVLQSLQSAQKTNSIGDKYHKLRRELLCLWEDNLTGSNAPDGVSSEDFQSCYYLLGVVALCAKDWDYGIEPLVRAKKYRLAAYAARKAEKQDLWEVLLFCSAFSKEDPGVISKELADACFQRCDITPADELLNTYQENASVSGILEDFIRYVSVKADFPMEIAPSNGAYECAKQMLSGFPSQWREKTGSNSIIGLWNEYKSYSYPRCLGENSEQQYISEIKRFRPDNNGGTWGSIVKGGNPNQDGDYFVIEQVYNDNPEALLLRQMLCAGMATGLEVSYRLGRQVPRDTSYEQMNRPDGIGASDIRLTPEGVRKALSLLSRMKPLYRGHLSYNPNKQTWKLESEEIGKKNPLFFTDGSATQAIQDPYLRTFCLKFNDIKYQPVTFCLDEQGNPFNICWNRQRLSREPYAAKAQDVQVSDKEKWAWEAYERVFPILGSEQNPYPNRPFFSLPPLEEDMEAAPMLTWNKKTVEQTPPAVSSVAPAPAPFREKEFPVPSFPQGGKVSRFPGDFLSRGRRALLNHNYARAEACFRAYLNAGNFTESVVGDLVRVYIEQPERVKDAENVLKEYGERVPPEKLLNLKITVYDKMKDDQTLCPLYERAYQLSTTSIKKSHILGALMRSQVRLGNYKDALHTYERWRTLYQQNRYGADYAKFNAAVPSFDRQRAVCLYYLGEIEEARKISADLIRINPNDTAANDILDGKLDSKIPTPEESEDTYAEQILLFSDDKDISEIPSFVRKKIEDIALGTRQKRHVEGDKYIGSPQEAREDINRLLDKTTSTTRRERSDMLFTACKIILQINQHNDEANFEKANLPRYAGRAMAAWGDDVMVNPEINQLDTARMAYLYAVRLIRLNERMEQDWSNAYNRYLRSFFLGKELTASYIYKQAKTSSKDGVSADFLRESSLRDESMPDFLVGILQLLRAMRQNPHRQGILIQALSTKNENLCQSLWTHLCAFMERPQETFSFEGYKEMILDASIALTKRQEALSKCVNDASDSMTKGGLNDSVLKALNPEKWKMYLTHQDTRYLTLLHQALTTSQAYFKNSNFETREDCLRTTLQDLRALLQQIMNEPTEFSYEKLRPKIEAMITHFAETQAKLYEDSRPDISWQASEESHPLMEDGSSIHVECSFGIRESPFRKELSAPGFPCSSQNHLVSAQKSSQIW